MIQDKKGPGGELPDVLLRNANTRVSGTIIATHPVSKGTRAVALLNGDFTPLVIPAVRFDHLTLPNGDVAEMTTDVVERDTSVVRMQSTDKRSSIKDQVTEQIIRALLACSSGHWPHHHARSCSG